jgi:hypothetical protein
MFINILRWDDDNCAAYFARLERSKSPGAESVVGQFERYDGSWTPFERGRIKGPASAGLAIDSERGVGRRWRRNALKSPVQRKEKAGR